MVSRSVKKILVVDDEQDWRVRAGDSLAKAGYEVSAAADASEAMLLAEDPHLGLIIVDDNLAGESGLMLTKFLRRNHPEIPILLHASGECDELMLQHVIDRHADQWLAKGSLDELVVTVSGFMT